MKTKIEMYLLALIIVLISTLAFAVSGKIGSPEDSQIIRLPIEGGIASIDPGLASAESEFEIIEQLFLSLTSFDLETYQPIPELAEQWMASSDGKVYSFKLRKDVVWTDNSPVTAHDLVWTMRRNISPETGASYANVMYIIKNAEDINKGDIKDISQLGVKAVDDFTVEFTLEHPAVYFPSMVALSIFRPLPSRVITEYDRKWTDPAYIQTNGPYKLAEREKGNYLLLKKNPNYIGKVSIDQVRYSIVPESSVGFLMYEKGDLDLIGGKYLKIPLDKIPYIEAHPVLSKQYCIKLDFTTYFYGFNTKKPPVDDPLVRKAISAAIDRQLIIDAVTKGDEEPATTLTRPPIFGSVDPLDNAGITFNPVQARKWLKEAGYNNGKDFPEITLLYNTSEFHQKIASAVKSLLKKHLNIDIKIESMESSKYWDTIYQPTTPHIFRYSFTADYPDANNWLFDLLHPFKARDMLGWKNQEFADLLDEANIISDPEKRKNLYYRAEKILCKEEAAIAPLIFQTCPYLVKPWVKRWDHSAIGGQQICDWHIDTSLYNESKDEDRQVK